MTNRASQIHQIALERLSIHRVGASIHCSHIPDKIIFRERNSNNIFFIIKDIIEKLVLVNKIQIPPECPMASLIAIR